MNTAANTTSHARESCGRGILYPPLTYPWLTLTLMTLYHLWTTSWPRSPLNFMSDFHLDWWIMLVLNVSVLDFHLLTLADSFFCLPSELLDFTVFWPLLILTCDLTDVQTVLIFNVTLLRPCKTSLTPWSYWTSELCSAFSMLTPHFVQRPSLVNNDRGDNASPCSSTLHSLLPHIFFLWSADSDYLWDLVLMSLNFDSYYPFSLPKAW